MHKKFFLTAIDVLKLFSYYGDCKTQFRISAPDGKNGRPATSPRAIKIPDKDVVMPSISQNMPSLFIFSDIRPTSYYELKEASLEVLFLIYNDLLRECNVCPGEKDLQDFLKSPAPV